MCCTEVVLLYVSEIILLILQVIIILLLLLLLIIIVIKVQLEMYDEWLRVTRIRWLLAYEVIMVDSKWIRL